MSLAGDGVTDEFFFLLWCKSKSAGSDAHRQKPALFLPDTVVYKCGQPCAWYFTSSSSGAILRKNRHNLTSARIEEGFTKEPAVGDVVAAYLTLPNVFMEEEKIGGGGSSSSSSSSSSTKLRPPTADGGCGEGGGSCIEYLDRAGLHEFLFRRRKDCGILQRFVEPKGPRNAVIRAIWSPKVCVVERRTNRHAIHDRRFGLYERTVTYEGPDHHSEATPLRGSLLVGKLERLCRDLTEHIAAVTGQRQRIARCVLNFKVDANDRVYLLWPSSIRLAEPSGGSGSGSPSSPEPGASSSSGGGASRRRPSSRLYPRHALDIEPQLHVPRGMRLADAPSHSVQQPRPTPIVPCPGCSASVPADCIYPVPYRTIAARHHHAATTIATTDDDAPPLLRRLHPSLTSTPEAYRRLRADPLFAGQSARVCEDCFLALTE